MGNNNCSEIDKKEWLLLPNIASSIGVEKIAIALNDSNKLEMECLFIINFIEACENKVKVDITTLSNVAELLYDYNVALNRGSLDILGFIDVLSISIDENKISDNEELEHFLDIAGKIKGKVGSLNANFLITSKGVLSIDDGLFDKLLEKFDTVHILFEKPFTYTKDEFNLIIAYLLDNGIFDNNRFIIDPCVLLPLNLVDHCHSCSYIIDINPYGDVAGCAYSHKNYPIGNIAKMEELPNLLEKITECWVTDCKFLKFAD